MQEEQLGLLQHSSVRHRLKSWLFSVNFSHSFLRGITMNIAIVCYTTILTAVIMMKDTIQRGDLPWYTVDVIIFGVSFLQSIVAPVIAWAGWWRRRTTIMAWMVPTAIAVFAILAVPSVAPSKATELCKLGSFLPAPISSIAVTRLVLLLIMGLVVSLTLTAAFCHGIGYMAEHNLEGLVLPFGVLVMVRAVGFLFFSRTQGEVPSYIQVILVCVIVIIHLIQLLKVPETPPPAEGTIAPSQESRGLLTSIGRVVSNKVAMTLIFAMAFNAAALWGFAYYEQDIIKVKYLQTYSPGVMSTQTDILRLHGIFLVVWVIGLKYSPQLMPTFARGSVLKMSTIFAVMAVPMYVVASLLYCNQGTVAGLSPTSYNRPNCSSQCVCDRTKNTFAPVCVVEQMTTYLSPCHAGCTEGNTANGLKYLSGCICTSGNGRAMNGACSISGCRDIFEYHKLLFLILVTLTVVILQLLGVVVIRAVDSRDRSVVVGVMTSVTSFVVFVAGHSIFFAIGANTCLWFEAGSCQLYSPTFTYLIGGVAAAFALIAAIVCIGAYYFLRDRETQKIEEQNGLAM